MSRYESYSLTKDKSISSLLILLVNSVFGFLAFSMVLSVDAINFGGSAFLTPNDAFTLIVVSYIFLLVLYFRTFLAINFDSKGATQFFSVFLLSNLITAFYLVVLIPNVLIYGVFQFFSVYFIFGLSILSYQWVRQVKKRGRNLSLFLFVLFSLGMVLLVFGEEDLIFRLIVFSLLIILMVLLPLIEGKWGNVYRRALYYYSLLIIPVYVFVISILIVNLKFSSLMGASYLAIGLVLLIATVLTMYLTSHYFKETISVFSISILGTPHLVQLYPLVFLISIVTIFVIYASSVLFIFYGGLWFLLGVVLPTLIQYREEVNDVISLLANVNKEKSNENLNKSIATLLNRMRVLSYPVELDYGYTVYIRAISNYLSSI